MHIFKWNKSLAIFAIIAATGLNAQGVLPLSAVSSSLGGTGKAYNTVRDGIGVNLLGEKAKEVARSPIQAIRYAYFQRYVEYLSSNQDGQSIDLDEFILTYGEDKDKVDFQNFTERLKNAFTEGQQSDSTDVQGIDLRSLRQFLIAEYKMDEASSDSVYDDSESGNQATAVNVPSGEGKLCYGRVYDNLDDSHYIKTNSPIDRGGESEITVMGWIYVFGDTGSWVNVWHLTPSDRDLDGDSREPALWLDNSDNRKFHGINDAVDSSNVGIDVSSGLISYGSWHHIVQSISGNVMKLYIDGQLTDLYESRNGNFKTDNGYFYIGDRWYLKNFKIDEVKIFLKVFDDQTIDSIYNNENQGFNWDGTTRECP